ncbi:C-type lectin lectoxin-Thr1-like [Mercenaria mercenaria]|uniref:C-type lectin lectoxin-Thr1-like n=1 Tax=Mercenaria mercenaria TaxID=6596 RepID=UPI00234E9AC3|nr:C-type lectin lectoxin-Thr1-like [Mercenaria mercenaria]
MNGVTLAFYIVICVTVHYIQGSPTTTDVNGTEPGDMDGKKLVEIGKKLKLPKLRLIGKTIENLELKNRDRVGICGGFCPKDYNVTKNGFCVKLYSDKQRTQTQVSAEQQCQDDGGHLMNIDSEEKYEDVSSLLKGFSSGVWIDGHRKDVSSPWQYKYGSQKGFFKWKSGQPSNGSNELCLLIYLSSGTTLVWYDNTCGSNYYNLCEII